MLQHPNTMIEKPIRLAAQKPTNPYVQGWWALSLCTLLLLSCYAHAENASRIVKWKDEKGVTHYGDKIPPQYVNRENSVINKQGVTVKHNKAVNHQDLALDIAKQEQEKKDRALLGAFTNADEIDLARDRNIQLDMIALENLNQEKINSQKRYADNKKLADGYTKKKKPIPADLSTDIAANREEVTKIDQRINERKQVIESTRKRFDEDKKRYLELKNPMSAATSAPTPASGQAPAASASVSEKTATTPANSPKP